jgi:DNA-3-methyladenine glycosylase II
VKVAPNGTVVLPLPADFRVDDVLAFHRRDPLGCAEQVADCSLAKGMVLGGQPARLTIRFASGKALLGLDSIAAVGGDRRAAPHTAHAAFYKTTAPAGAEPSLTLLARHMLGLDQDIRGFEAAFRHDPELGPLLQKQAGLRIPLTPEPFEALAWAITGQQISVSAAVAIRRRLILACAIRHPSGLHCFPDAASVGRLPLTTLREAGYSAAKATTLQKCAKEVADGSLPLAQWLQQGPHADAAVRLQALAGVGPWTVHYTLLRGFGWLDGTLHGDVAVRRSLMQLLGAATLPSPTQTEQWLARFAPWRALAAAHLWAALGRAASPPKDGLRAAGALVA